MDELFDIVDTEDRVIGSAYRSEVHGDPSLIHRVAHVLVFTADGRLLLQRRSAEKSVQPGKWDTSVGGHVPRGESYEAAAQREAAEEIGLLAPTLTRLYSYLHRNDYESEYVTTFSCVNDGPFEPEPNEIAELRFFRLSDILESRSSGVYTPNFLDELDRYLALVR